MTGAAPHAPSGPKYPGGAAGGGQRPPPLLTIERLSLTINGTPLLHEVSLVLAPGEITALTGESGSGKSLTALSVMGLLPPGARTSGRILLGDCDLLSLPEEALCALRGDDVGMIFQEPMTALNPVQTIGAQVAETVRIHTALSRAAARTRAAETLARVGLGSVPLDRYPHELSGGQRQRVVIAMAIALRPRLLIADEPTTALDVTTQARILDLLKRLVAEDGMALLLITHDLAVVAEVADRIAVLQRGRVVETGATEAVLRAPRDPYTRALLAASTHAVDLAPAPPPRPLLSVQNVTRRYRLARGTLLGPARSLVAVNDVSFTVAAGERLGLVGESGCGKSTLTRAILGLEPVDGGAVTLDGAPVGPGRTAPATMARMQMVFQDPYGSFDPRHRVGRSIAEPFHLMADAPTGAARAAAVARALTDVGLSPADADRYPHEFSGGQRQRLAIARALITTPDLVVFDEAVSALDVSVRAQVLDLIADLGRRRPFAYLFISHDLTVVRSVTDRVMVMQAGRIVEEGPTEAVFTAPRHAYTRTLLAAAPTLTLPARETA